MLFPDHKSGAQEDKEGVFEFFSPRSNHEIDRFRCKLSSQFAAITRDSPPALARRQRGDQAVLGNDRRERPERTSSGIDSESVGNLVAMGRCLSCSITEPAREGRLDTLDEGSCT